MRKGKHLFGIILIVIGVIFLLKNFISVPFFDVLWNYFWTIALIVVGFQKKFLKIINAIYENHTQKSHC